MTVLLDANVLIALSVTDHVHHELAEDWFVGNEDGFATCPTTQGSLVRFLLRSGADVTTAVEILRGLEGAAGHEFWPDDLPYRQVAWRGVLGHRQVTDAYLAAIARGRGGRLATLDRGMSLLHADIALLLA